MSIIIFTGLPGAGKSYKLARTAIDMLYRNKRFYERQLARYERGDIDTPPVLRPLVSNLRFSDEVVAEFPGQIFYWKDTAELISMRDVDVLWDEIAVDLDATHWANMSLELKRWLQQHRKRGVDIYGTAQDFAQIDKSMRRLCSDLVYLKKLIGSGDKSATRPEVEYVWGIIFSRSLDPVAYDESKSKQQAGVQGMSFMWLSRKLVDVFDTTQEIEAGKYPPMRHIERDCEVPNCPFHKVMHV